ncbi:MAG: hypothetical protein ISS47_09145 [Candidatus Omnitrophica bacterium]|nr:hypothetical protein [Candidatus Omnitrophota bacterium]
MIFIDKKNLIPEQEWEILNSEVFENKPLVEPFPEDIVKRRELLLFAQCLLSDYQFAKSKKYRKFFGELYRKTMETYFNW